MAVMKTFCGCCSTKTGALVVLFFNLVLYVAGIVLTSMKIANKGSFFIQGNSSDCSANSTSASWWCGVVQNPALVERNIFIGKLSINIVLLLFTLLGIYGCSTEKARPMLPSIITEFLLWLLFLAVGAGFIFLLVVYSPVDLTTTISLAVVVVLILAFLLYLWLCVVAHYQIIREVKRIQRDKVKRMQYPQYPIEETHHMNYPTHETTRHVPREDDELEDIMLDEKIK